MIPVRCCHADEEASHSSQVICIRPLDWLGAMAGIEPFPLWGSKFVGRGLENHITGHSHYLFIAPGLDPSATKRSGETSDWARERPREFVVPSSCALSLPFHLPASSLVVFPFTLVALSRPLRGSLLVLTALLKSRLSSALVLSLGGTHTHFTRPVPPHIDLWT